LNIDHRVEDRQRGDPVPARGSQLEPVRPADVVGDEVEAIEPQLVDRRAQKRPRLLHV